MAYQIMFYGGLAGAVIALVIAVLTYVKLNIAQVITDLTGWNFPGAGRKARKATTSRQTETITKPTTKEIHVRKNVDKEVAAGEYVEPTEKMASAQIESTALLSKESFKQTDLLKKELEPTALLTPDGYEPTALLKETPVREPVAAAVSSSRSGFHESPTQTTILSDWNETTVLTADSDETTLLGETTILDDFEETTLLTEEEPRFQKKVDIMIVHSNTIM